MVDLILYAIGLWLMSGLVPSILMMFARGRQGYYVDPLAPLRGAIQGPIALWAVVMRIRRGQY